jgi:hypothetical protein
MARVRNLVGLATGESTNTSPERLFQSFPERRVYGRRINDLRRQRRGSHTSHKLNMLPQSESQFGEDGFQLRLFRRNSPAAQKSDSIFESRTLGHLNQNAIPERMRLYTIFCSRAAHALVFVPFKLITQLGYQLHQLAAVSFGRGFGCKLLPTLSLMGFVAAHAHLQMRQVHTFYDVPLRQARHKAYLRERATPPGCILEIPFLSSVAIQLPEPLVLRIADPSITWLKSCGNGRRQPRW